MGEDSFWRDLSAELPALRPCGTRDYVFPGRSPWYAKASPWPLVDKGIGDYVTLADRSVSRGAAPPINLPDLGPRSLRLPSDPLIPIRKRLLPDLRPMRKAAARYVAGPGAPRPAIHMPVNEPTSWG